MLQFWDVGELGGVWSQRPRRNLDASSMQKVLLALRDAIQGQERASAPRPLPRDHEERLIMSSVVGEVK